MEVNENHASSAEIYTPEIDALDDRTPEQILDLPQSHDSPIELKYELNVYRIYQ